MEDNSKKRNNPSIAMENSTKILNKDEKRVEILKIPILATEVKLDVEIGEID